MGRPRHPGVRAAALRHRAVDRHRAGGYGNGTAAHAAGGPVTLTPDILRIVLPELALFALAVLVLLIGAVARVPPRDGIGGPSGRGIAGWLTLLGLIATFVLTFFVPEGSSLMGASFVQD